MEDLIRTLLIGLGVGAIYVLCAQGLITIFRGSGVLNLGLGAIGMVGAYVAWTLNVNNKVPFWAVLIIGVTTSALIGVVVQLLVMRPLRKRSPLVRIIATLGVMLTLQALIILIFNSTIRQWPSNFPNKPVPITDTISINPDRLILLGIAIIVTILLWLFYKYTRFGLGTTAVAENETVAASLGWSPNTIAVLNWAIGSALAGLAAILIVQSNVGLRPGVFSDLVLAATSVALVASFRSFPIALLTGLVMGVVQTLVNSWITSIGDIGKAVPLIFIVVWMMVRGQGIPQRDYILQRLPSVGLGKLRWNWIVPALALLLVAMWTVTPQWLNAYTVTMAVAIMILSIVVLTGYAGQLSLAQFALAIFAAFVAGRLAATGWPFRNESNPEFDYPFLVVLAAGIIAVLVLGAIFAIPAIRTRGISLAILTLGLGTTLELVLFKNQNWTGGLNPGSMPPPSIFGWNFLSTSPDTPQNYTIVVMIALVLMLILVSNVRRGRVGRRLLAVRANERAAAALGINVRSAKLYAFTIAAGIAGVGGIFYLFRNSAPSYAEYSNFGSIILIADAMIGGIGYLAGSVLGGTLFDGGLNSQTLLQLGDVKAWIPLIGGVGLLIMVLLNQDGIAAETSGQAKMVRGFLKTGGPVGKRLAVPVVGLFLVVGIILFVPQADWGNFCWFAIALILSSTAVGMKRRDLAGLATRIILGLLTLGILLWLNGHKPPTWSTTFLITLFLVVIISQMVATMILLEKAPFNRSSMVRIGLFIPIIGAVILYATNASTNEGRVAFTAYGLILFGLAVSVWGVQRGDKISMVQEGIALLLPTLLAAILYFAGQVPEAAPLLLMGQVPVMAMIAWRHREFNVWLSILGMAIPTAASLVYLGREDNKMAVIAIFVAQLTYVVAIIRARTSAVVRTVMFVVGEAVLGAIFFYVLTMWTVSVAIFVLAVIKIVRTIPAAKSGRVVLTVVAVLLTAAGVVYGGIQSSWFLAGLLAVGAILFWAFGRTELPPNYDLPTQMGEVEKVRPRTLEARGITVRYGGTTAVNTVDLFVRPGQITGLIGPNGAGKTSFIDAVTGFTKISEGAILLDGQDVSSWSTTKRARAGVGRSFQALELFEDCSVIDNLKAASDPRDFVSYLRDLFYPKEAKLTATTISAIREFDLEGDLGRGVDDLSYGKRRLLAIARAVAAQPSVLLLDEPAAGLNESESRELAKLVKRLADDWGMAILLVEHDVNFVMSVCNEVVVLDFGSKISHGTPNEVRNDPAVIAAYLGQEDPEQAANAQAAIKSEEHA